MDTSAQPQPFDDGSIMTIERPSQSLLALYFLQAAATLVAFPFVFLPLLFRYITLRYSFDDEGVSARWGVLFRREIHLTYRRIQDIHVRRNFVERWLGIGRVEIQTASGSAAAELALEGMEQYEQVRDFLYGRMRGARGEVPASRPGKGAAAVADGQPGESEAVAMLRSIRQEVEGARQALKRRG